MDIIRDTSAVYTAPLDALNATYRALRGVPDHPGFTSVEAARPAVTNAIMAAQDVVGHQGVPPGTRPAAKTVEELGYNPYTPGTICHRLHEEITKQPAITPRPRRADNPEANVPKRTTLKIVRATGKGTSKLSAKSTRAAVLAAIARRPDGVAAVSQLEADFNIPVRGYLQKLLEKGHIEVVENE